MIKNSLLIIALIFLVSCSSKPKGELVQIETEFGVIKIKLYDETPEHKKNFLKLIDEGFYDDLLFHRVINNFMIQGGDPNSKDATQGEQLGSGGPGYTIPAEINPKYFHKKGVLAAARQPDQVNPEKRSSGSQFYIVEGRKFTREEIEEIEEQKISAFANSFLKELFKENMAEFKKLQEEGKQDELSMQMANLKEKAHEMARQQSNFSYSEEQIETYATIGGYPSLDNEYTVFGEVVKGLDILEQISDVETNQSDRPVTDVKFKISITEK